MIKIILGAVLLVAISAFYWYLLPRNGQVNRLVKKADVGSLVMITIISVVCLGIALVIDGLLYG